MGKDKIFATATIPAGTLGPNDVMTVHGADYVETPKGRISFERDPHTQAKYAERYFYAMILPRVQISVPRQHYKQFLRESVSVYALAVTNAGEPKRDVQSAETA